MTTKKDQMRLGPPRGPGRGTAIRRIDDKLHVGTFAEARDGQPLPEGAELVSLSPADDEGWHDVTSIYERARSGPAQVATPRYRDGHDRIFGGKQNVGLA